MRQIIQGRLRRYQSGTPDVPTVIVPKRRTDTALLDDLLAKTAEMLSAEFRQGERP